MAKINTSAFTKKLKELVSTVNAEQLEQAAADLENCIKTTIRDSIGSNYASGNISSEFANTIINEISHSGLVYVNKNTAKITIHIGEDVARMSLFGGIAGGRSNIEYDGTIRDMGHFGGVYDIVSLLDEGYVISSDKSAPIGIWHGRKITALRERAGAQFIEKGIELFLSSYAGKYNMTRENIIY